MADPRTVSVTVRPARAAEAASLSALAIRSKAHWGYTEAQMKVFRDELTLSSADLAPRPPSPL